MPESKYKTIKVKEQTYERLQFHGKMGESFDDLINRLLDKLQIEKDEK